MLRNIIFGKKGEAEHPTMASSITMAEFKDALNRYPAVLAGLNKPGKFLYLYLRPGI
jgi:hypothetical protein